MDDRFTGFERAMLLIAAVAGAFGLLGGDTYGWTVPREVFRIRAWAWPFHNVSVIPFVLWVAATAFALFLVSRYFGRREEPYLSWDDIPTPEVRHRFKPEPEDLQR